MFKVVDTHFIKRVIFLSMVFEKTCRCSLPGLLAKHETFPDDHAKHLYFIVYWAVRVQSTSVKETYRGTRNRKQRERDCQPSK